MSLKYLTGSMPTPGKVTPMIGGQVYFDEFFENLSNLQAGDKLFLLNWTIDPVFYQKDDPDDDISDKTADQFLWTQLQRLVSIGVDVRILVWVNTNLFEPLYPLKKHGILGTVLEGSELDLSAKGIAQSFGGGFLGYIDSTLRTVHFWRNQSATTPETDKSLENRIIINTLDAMMGGCHAKFALFLKKQPSGEYRGTGYTGGIDPVNNRYSEPPYKGFHVFKNADGSIVRDAKGIPIAGETHNFWHDIMAKVEGVDTVAQLFLFYKNLWDENVARKEGYNPTIHYLINSKTVGIVCIPQGANEIDEISFDSAEEATKQDHLIQSVSTIPSIFPIFGEPEISFAPDGNFGLRDSVHRIFACAERYIYIEDQAMESLELFGLIKDALVRNSELRVILITMHDPADAPIDPTETPITIDKKLINHFYYSKLTPQQKQRLRFFRANYTIHSKLYIVDDQVAIIGSAGLFTRSMTEELEHAVVYIDSNGGETIKGLRECLWTLHTGKNFSTLSTIEDAVAVWDQDDPFGNDDMTSSEMGLVRIDLDQSALIDISEFWQEIPGLLIKRNLDGVLTDEEKAKLQALENYLPERAEALSHLLGHEIPFSSIFNPSRLTVVGVPLQDKEKFAVQEKARLRLMSSELSTITWEYAGTDGTPKSGTGDTFEIQFSTPGPKIVRAIQTFSENDLEQEYPFTFEVLENSGPHWVERFQTSRAVSDLSDDFRPKVERFLQALDEAGLPYQILATFRPPERAYLMAYAWKINHGLNPAKVQERLENVNISWLHYTANGEVDLTASRQAAQAMVAAYNIGPTGAVYPSFHSEGNAIDLKIEIPQPVMVRNSKGDLKPVSKQRHLSRIALSYEIRRLGQSNHWSMSGH